MPVTGSRLGQSDRKRYGRGDKPDPAPLLADEPVHGVFHILSDPGGVVGPLSGERGRGVKRAGKRCMEEVYREVQRKMTREGKRKVKREREIFVEKRDEDRCKKKED